MAASASRNSGSATSARNAGNGEPEDLAVPGGPSPGQPSHGKSALRRADPYLTSYQHLWMSLGKPAPGRYVDKPPGDRQVAVR